MKFALRFFAMLVVFAGLATASLPSVSSQVLPSHLSAAAAGPGPLTLPAPVCQPGIPTCPTNPPPGGGGNLQ